MYDKEMAVAKQYLKDNKEELLEKLNDTLFQEQWDKYALGNYSKWEMDSLGMYYHEHELKNINKDYYGIYDFESLGRQPIVDYTFKRKGINIPVFKTQRIVGTVIAKNDMQSSITLLTPLGSVINVKMNRDYFAKYNKRISEVQSDGTKKVKEAGWFQKGTLIMVNGIRREDNFFCKTYAKDKKEGKHRLYKIIEVKNDGTIEFTNKRYGENTENE